MESSRAYASPHDARAAIRFYGRIAMVVGCVIVLISLAAFVSTSLADKIKGDVTIANGFAATSREIDG